MAVTLNSIAANGVGGTQAAISAGVVSGGSGSGAAISNGVASGGGSGGGGGATLPAGLVFQVSADSLSQADNTTVTGLVDSVNGATCTVTGTPKFRTAIVGGKPVIRFDGASNLNFSTTAAVVAAIDSQTYAVYIVANNIAAKANAALLTMCSASGVGGFYMIGNGARIGVLQSSALNELAAAWASTAQITMGLTPGRGIAGATDGTFEPTRVWLNGGAAATTNVRWNTSGGNPLVIGARSDNTNAGIFDMTEVMIFNTVHTPAQVVQVQKWIANKYSQALPWAASNGQLVVQGNSIIAGYNTSMNDYRPTSVAASQLGLALGQFSNLGVSGIPLDSMNAIATTQVDPLPAALGYPIKLVGFEYVNDAWLVHTKTAAAVTADMQTYIQNRRAALGATSRILFTAPIDSTNDETDTNTKRNTVIASLIAGYSSWGADGLVRADQDANIGVAGAVNAGSEATYFQADKVHLTAAVTSSGGVSLGTAIASGITAVG